MVERRAERMSVSSWRCEEGKNLLADRRIFSVIARAFSHLPVIQWDTAVVCGLSLALNFSVRPPAPAWRRGVFDLTLRVPSRREREILWRRRETQSAVNPFTSSWNQRRHLTYSCKPGARGAAGIPGGPGTSGRGPRGKFAGNRGARSRKRVTRAVAAHRGSV